MDRGAWQTTVCEVTRVGHDLATKLLHNGILLSQKKHEILPFATWRIPWTEEPGRLQSVRSQELVTT